MDTQVQQLCAHCGEPSPGGARFCCSGCKMVYELLNENGLCAYYEMNERPGIAQRVPVRKDKFAFLEDDKVQQQLIHFQDHQQTHVTFYIPHIHCSSCLWLLENLHHLDPGIQQVNVNFTRKEARIIFHQQQTSLRKVAETLTSIGYEPYISLQDLGNKKPAVSRRLIYQLGVAGFCFANIMLLSFPEYFSSDHMETGMSQAFRYLNLALSLPVFLFSAQAFYASAWKGLKHGFLNIDVPIVLAIVVTFVRSLVDVLSGAGAGYFDSMTGIVLFMLTGRILQDKTYQGLSFDRDYTAYFPIAVSVIKGNKEIPTVLPDVKAGDTLLVHHQELVPADGILVKGKAMIDYSFVTGESQPVIKNMGELIYAGGRQLEGNIEILTIREVAQSYLTSLWNRDELKGGKKQKASFIHLAGQYFTWVVLCIAAITTIYWGISDPSKIWPAVTAILIIACPCALLLAASFTNGHILRILSRHHLYLRNAQAIESLATTSHIVFDKTGTLTSRGEAQVTWHGRPLSLPEKDAIATLTGQSQHPASKVIQAFLGQPFSTTVAHFTEQTGQGIEGTAHHLRVRIGSAGWTGMQDPADKQGSIVHVKINRQPAGYFCIRNSYREGIENMLQKLQYPLTVLSGDHDGEERTLRAMMPGAVLHFRQQPDDKLNYILRLQEQGKRVLMIGDGLNDAGALKQSDTGISLTEHNNNFTPASDGILEGSQLEKLPAFIRFCKMNKRIILFSFAYSTIYNITGLYFAVQGILSPLTAAILMPSSSISLILITYGISEWAGKRLLR